MVTYFNDSQYKCNSGVDPEFVVKLFHILASGSEFQAELVRNLTSVQAEYQQSADFVLSVGKPEKLFGLNPLGLGKQVFAWTLRPPEIPVFGNDLLSLFCH